MCKLFNISFLLFLLISVDNFFPIFSILKISKIRCFFNNMS